MARPSVRLVADAVLPVEALAASRLGGAPDLPPAITWPRNDDEPLSFIAQVNLADVAAYDSEGVLPRAGLLSFFYDAVTQDAWGFDPADHGSAAVIYTSAHVATEHREPPADLADDGVFRALGLRPVQN
ncbi:YwqG family protein [Kribbella sp. NBC_01510]